MNICDVPQSRLSSSSAATESSSGSEVNNFSGSPMSYSEYSIEESIDEHETAQKYSQPSLRRVKSSPSHTQSHYSSCDNEYDDKFDDITAAYRYDLKDIHYS